MPVRYPDRDRVMAEVCELAARGAVENQLATRPDLPCAATIWQWRRQDPAFDARFRRERQWGRALRTQSIHATFVFNDLKALEIVDRVRRGEHIQDLLRLPGFPNRPRFDSWRRQRPDFAQAIRAARAARDRVRPTRRPRGFDQDVADRVAALVNAGVPLQDVVRRPGMPGPKVLARWRRQQPEFDAVIRVMRQGGAKNRGRASEAANRARLTPEICRRIVEGAPIGQLARQPGMPTLATFYRWLRTDPAFARAVTRAREARDDRLSDQALDIAEAANAATAKSAEREIRRLQGRIGRMQPRKAW